LCGYGAFVWTRQVLKFGSCQETLQVFFFFLWLGSQLRIMSKILLHFGVAVLVSPVTHLKKMSLNFPKILLMLFCPQCLLKHGADLDLKNEEEQTPVHLAAKFGRTK
jgi:hypothetical protein